MRAEHLLIIQCLFLGTFAEAEVVVSLHAHACCGLVSTHCHSLVLNAVGRDWPAVSMAWMAWTVNVAVFVPAVVLFHASEPLLHRWLHPRDTDWDSALLSRNYVLAQSLGLLEFVTENWLFGSSSFKHHWTIAASGAILIVAGELLRKAAILTAGKSFHHVIARRRAPHHRLVTTGVYAIVRHPAYLGFLVWAIGTQVALGNPLCTVAFACVLIPWFHSRIAYEESLLMSPRFFGDDYAAYQRTVPALLPFPRPTAPVLSRRGADGRSD